MRNLKISELEQITGALCMWPLEECTDDEKIDTAKYLRTTSLGLSVGLAAGVFISPVEYQFYGMLAGTIVGGVLTPMLLMPYVNDSWL